MRSLITITIQVHPLDMVERFYRSWSAYTKTRSFGKSDRPLNVPIQVDSVALIHEAHSSLDVCAGCVRVQWSCGAQP